MQKSPSHVKHDSALAKEQSLERKILEWMANGKKGASSEVMAFCVVGMTPPHITNPYDAQDFNRCLNLVHEVLEIREHFPAIAKLSPEWMATISNWDRLEKSFLNEVGLNFSKRSTAPITNQLLRDLRAKR
jgi:hypothetical protein